MWEFEIIKDNKTVDYIYGYSATDALRRRPEYDTNEYSFGISTYID